MNASWFIPNALKVAVLAPLSLSLILVGCGKDEEEFLDTIYASSPAVPVVYAVSDTERIALSTDGIAYEYITDGKTLWVLSYQEIAQHLGVDVSQNPMIHISKGCIQENGMLNFNICFDSEPEGKAYSIYVTPKTGEIASVLRIEEMSGGEITLSITVTGK